MATRAEQFRTQEQRHTSRKTARTKSVKSTPATKAAAKKNGSSGTHRVRSSATYALEPQAADGRRSRKSTRASANRAKPDTNFNLRESLVKGSPEARFRKSRAKSTRVRGSKA